MKIIITLLLLFYVLGASGQECANHREKSAECGATSDSVADKCCDGLICNKKKSWCKKEKCAKAGQRSRECRSPSGVSKCCEGLVCSKKKRRCVEASSESPSGSSSPTESPTEVLSSSPSEVTSVSPTEVNSTSPTLHTSSPTAFPSYSPSTSPSVSVPGKSPTQSPTVAVPFKILKNKKCKKAVKNLGKTFSTVEQCIAAAKADSACTGSEVIWHSKYNKYYGCSCCSEHVSCPAKDSAYYSSSGWDTHEYQQCKTYPDHITANKACRYRAKNLGKSFTTAAQCMEAAKADPACDGVEIMYSVIYNKYWGCNCCKKNPTCPATSNRYYDSSYWDVHQYKDCPTPSPTTSPTTPSPSTSPSHLPTAVPSTSASPSISASPTVPLEVRKNEKCRALLKNLGKTFSTVEQCIAAAKADSACTGSEVVWHSKYNKYYGCSCCGEHASCPAKDSAYYSSSGWDTHEYQQCKTYPDHVTASKACRYRGKNLGKTFTTAAQCMEAAKADSGCDGNEIMYSVMYNKYWGCTCCKKNPTCPATSNRYYDTTYYNVYKYEECS